MKIHSCPECLYETDRDIASAQELCNRGIETYPGTPEKQEIDSQEDTSVRVIEALYQDFSLNQAAEIASVLTDTTRKILGILQKQQMSG